MHGTVETAAATGEHGAARRRNDLNVPPDIARAGKPTTTRGIAKAPVYAPSSPSAALSAEGSQVATDGFARRDSKADACATVAEEAAAPSMFSTGKGPGGSEMMAADLTPTPVSSSTGDMLRPAAARMETAQRAALLRETVAGVFGASWGGDGAVSSTTGAFKAVENPAILSAAFSAEISGDADADADADADTGAGAGEVAVAGTKVVYIVPEQTPPAVRLVLERRPGWTEWDAEVHGADQWNFQWRSGRFKPSEYSDVREEQRVNHFPRSSLITRKDLLLRVLRKMKAVHGEVYAFHPDSYLLPTEYTKFIDVFTRLQPNRRSPRRGSSPSPANEAAGDGPDLAMLCKPSLRNVGRTGGAEDAGDGGALWIVKPSDSSRGRGVYLLRELGELAYDRFSIVQRYISDPLTVGGYKADLRLYVVVTSLHPMRVSLYRDGIVRFATSKYDLSPHDDVFGHLTNCSINKRSPFASQEKEVIGEGCKWTLTRLQRW